MLDLALVPQCWGLALIIDFQHLSIGISVGPFHLMISF